MITHLLTRIDLMMNSLSKGQKRIALFIEEHYDKAAFMTASKLGETVGVSESTVVRFATELGYDGYPKLQKAMQEMIRNKLTSVQRIEVTSNRIGNDNVLDSVLNQDIDKIRRTIEETGIHLKSSHVHVLQLFDDPSRIVSFLDGNIYRVVHMAYNSQIDEFPDTKVSKHSIELKWVDPMELEDYDIVVTHQEILEQYFIKYNIPNTLKKSIREQ